MAKTAAAPALTDSAAVPDLAAAPVRPGPALALVPTFVPPSADSARRRSRSARPVPSLPPSPREIVRNLAAKADLWGPHVRFTEPRFHHRLASGARWEAWLLAWLPGQSTGLHDHGDSSGAFAVLVGSIDEDLPLRVPPAPGAAPARPASNRMITRRYQAGHIRTFGSEHVHDVAARSGRPAVTLHVYAPRLTMMTRYALSGDGRLVETAREREGVDW